MPDRQAAARFGPGPTGHHMEGGPLARPRAALLRASIIGLLVLLLLGPVGVLGAQATHPVAGPHGSPGSVAVATTPADPSPRSVASEAGSVEGCAASGASAAPATTPAGPVGAPPAPLYNSQVEPYAVLTGPYGYVAAGAAIRDLGYGTINLTWPGAPATTSLVAAYLTWSILDNSLPTPNATLNGHALNGTWSAYASPSPCWGATYIYTFIADVTPWVLNGNNSVAGFPSAYTDGASPWEATPAYPMDDQAALVAVYDNDSLSTQQVTVYTGANTEIGESTLTATLDYSPTVATWAETTYLVSDGQLPGNAAVWNGTVIDANAFPGTDPKATTTTWSDGNLSDTRTFQLSVPLGSNNTTAEVYPTEGDCLTWIGQVVSVAVKPAAPPYPVTFSEQGLNNGTAWSVTANGTTVDGTVADAASQLEVDLGNNSYTFTVPAIPGYTGPTGGSFKVDGGPVYLRLLFHQVVYPVNVTETGLPVDSMWWARLTNTTDGISENESGYAGATLSTTLGNATYTYTAGEVGLYRADPSSGTFTVDGSSVNVTVTYVPPPLYNVTFQEKGLRPGTWWQGDVVTNFGDFVTDTNNTTAIVQLPNTTAPTDAFLAYDVPGYQAPGAVYFGVAGAPVTVLVTYGLLYTVDLNQTGLPLDTTWYALVTGGSVYTSSASAGETNSFAVPNGTYTFTVDPVWGYAAVPASGTVTVDGSNVTQAITFVAQPDYAITFNESGLASGTSWSVLLDLPNGSHKTVVSAGVSLQFEEPNGSYSYAVVAVAGYTSTPTYGDVVVEGAPTNVSVVFASVYAVTFQETGLPTGSYWYVEINDGYHSGYTSTEIVNLTNGSYSFSVVDYEGFTADPASGTVNVTGANVTVTISFSSATEPTFSLTFTESGLPPGSNWSVTVDEVTQWSTGSSITFTEPNDTWPFEVAGPDGYTPTPSSGDAVVDGADVNEPVTFAPVITGFAVTFTESGLPEGTVWYVNLTEGGSYSSSSTTLVLSSEADGTYDYTLGSSDRSYAATGGEFTVDGEALGVDVTFSLVTYTVTATETGLPGGTTWYLNVTEGSSHSSSSDEIVFVAPNGTYDYVLASAAAGYTAAGGEFTVDGGAVGVDVSFHAPALYVVTVTESGLPSGTTWFLNVTGGSTHSSSSTSMTFDEPNGTYRYVLGSADTSYAGPGQSFDVAGAGASVDVAFHLVTYALVFTETGLPSGTSWSVTLGGTTQTSTTASITFEEPNGSYSYTVASANASYTGHGGSKAVAGAGLSITVPFATSGGSGSSGQTTGFLGLPGSDGYLALGLLAALAVILGILLVARRRRKKPTQATTPPGGATGGPPTQGT